ncbi:hypothetical protein ABDB91_18890 [Desulfoscipio sp. XC116]|uniref:hypothetical protein n=1 Tax=Desulfoscipio sp. XC116 TaxID=3144975 RepID=UPI00325B62D4
MSISSIPLLSVPIMIFVVSRVSRTAVSWTRKSGLLTMDRLTKRGIDKAFTETMV